MHVVGSTNYRLPDKKNAICKFYKFCCDLIVMTQTTQTSEENLVREAWQKQLESEQLKVNPEEILEEEEKRTNPIYTEE